MLQHYPLAPLGQRYDDLGDGKKWNEEGPGMDIAQQATGWLNIPQHLQQAKGLCRLIINPISP